jgi:hypothetical protein
LKRWSHPLEYLKSVTPVSSPKCFAFSFKISSVNGTFLDLAFARAVPFWCRR